MLITEFWKSTYLPHVERNAKPSTVHGYKKLWGCYLAEEFPGKTLSEFHTADATRLLTQLAGRSLGSRTVAHVRSLMSGIFSHACCLGVIQFNPMRDAKSLERPAKPKGTYAYSLAEVQEILAALSSDPLAQLAVALCAYAALRPSEVAGLCWEDFQGDQIVLGRSVWCSQVSTSLKTEGSAATVPMLSILQSMVNSLRKSEGWVFKDRNGGPVNIDEYQRRHIAEPLRKRGMHWVGLYGCRRSAATLITELVGNPYAAAAILRHSNPSVTLVHYVKLNRAEMAAKGIAALESALQEQKALAAGTI